ncbi:outer membrane beta-barrel protein [Ferruginibacter yonginensis]|uniref:Outer membrane beta-barrel protein n=1 Tax=Ferruginibacter yonginensis TaxID=1310416 RepID=A0ABV8QVV9_9BACT
MRKILACCIAVIFTTFAMAQTTGKKSIKLADRAADHFLIQLANNSWNGTPDSVSKYIKGFNRSANVYVMIDKQFKGNQKFSVGIGVGIGNSNIYFDKMETKIGAFSSRLPFVRTDTGNNYKKYKLSTTFLELPVELRFMSKPSTPNKSFKAALGVKVGTLVNAHTKGKNLQTATGTKLNGFTVKESTRTYFNSTRLAATARVGYGMFSLFGAYNITNIFKDGVAADTKLLQIGITISGL